MFRRTLACSFCGRSARDVAKLVAGPKVYICDVCAARAIRIMEECSGDEAGPSQLRSGLFRAVSARLRGLWRRAIRRSDAHASSPRAIARHCV
jgi:ATP-dependent protease Clp ATPase subunit